MTDRTHQPPIRKPQHMVLHRPERMVWSNGVPLSVLRAGDNEVVRIDVLMEGGRWHQRYPCRPSSPTACCAKVPAAIPPPR